MQYLLCYLLLSYPLPVYEPMRFLRPTLYRVARDYQIIGPKEDSHGTRFVYEVRELRWRFGQVRNAPSIDETILLPDLDDCRSVERFWKRRIQCIEAELKLHGSYRYADFVEALDWARDECEIWRHRTMAADSSNTYLDRRRALRWLNENVW